MLAAEFRKLAIFTLRPDLSPLSVFCFPRVTLYAEFLPMKARAKCILLIEVRRMVCVLEITLFLSKRFPGILSHRTRKRGFRKIQ